MLLRTVSRPPGVVTDADLATVEVQLDKQYRQTMSGYRKISSRRLDVAGARGLEFVFDTKRLDLSIRQKSLMIPKYGTNYVLTFTSPTSHYEKAEVSCFNVIMLTLKIGDDYNSASQAEAKPLTPGTLRLDGLYYAKWPEGGASYLRFYKDGTVLNVSSTGTPEEVGQWLKKGHPASSKGNYTRNGATIKFSTKSSVGIVDYAGEVGQDVLRLQTHSRINGFKATSTYKFVKL